MGKADWGGGIAGATSGAATGTGLGGPVGGVVGGALGFLGGMFGGKKKKKKKKISTLDKRQQQLNESQHAAITGEGPLADLYNYDPDAANEVFSKNFANPAYREFKEKLAPEITGQFRNQGLQNSSYVGDALAKRGRDIQERLDAKRTEYLYGEQKDARNAKRDAVENLQNRKTFAYDADDDGSGGSNTGNWMDSLLNSVKGKEEGISDWIQDTALKYLPGGV